MNTNFPGTALCLRFGNLIIGKLKNYGYPVSEQEKDLVLGEKQAYRWNGTQLEVVPVRFFPSYEAFAEEAKTSEFKKALREMTVVYAVVRPAEQARKNPFGYQPIEVQLTNPNLAIPLGGEDQVRAIFLDNEEQALKSFKKVQNGKDTPIILTVTTPLKSIGEQVVEAWKKIGINAIVKYSTTLYTEVCLTFDQIPLRWKLDNGELCNTIQESSGEATTVAITTNTTTAGGGGATGDINDF